MARNELIYTATNGRDSGKKFQITEMSARAGHAWASRLFLALINSGMAMPQGMAGSGLAGLASMDLNTIGSIDSEVVLGLMDELLQCVRAVQEAGTRKWIDDDFEEIKTIFDLQKAVFDLHIQPFILGGKSTSASPPKEDQTAA